MELCSLYIVCSIINSTRKHIKYHSDHSLMDKAYVLREGGSEFDSRLSDLIRVLSTALLDAGDCKDGQRKERANCNKPPAEACNFFMKYVVWH